MYGVPMIDPYAAEGVPPPMNFHQPPPTYEINAMYGHSVGPVPPPVRSDYPGVDSRFLVPELGGHPRHNALVDRLSPPPPRRNSRERRHSPGRRLHHSPSRKGSRDRRPDRRDRSPRNKVRSPGKKYSRSPPRKHSRSPVKKYSRSPIKKYSRSPPPKKRLEREGREGPEFEEYEALSAMPGEIRVRNLPPRTLQREVDALFTWHIGDVTYCEVMENGTKAFVKFKSLDLAKKAVDKMYDFNLNDHLLKVSETTVEARKKLDALRAKHEADRPATKDYSTTYGLTVSFLESLNIEPPLVPTVLVENMDPEVTPYKLTEVFNLAGRVRHVAMSYDSQCRSKGEAKVEFEHPVEAIQAISMLNDQMLLDRKLRVTLYHEPPPDKIKFPDGLRGVGLGLGINGAPLKNIPQLLMGVEEKKTKEKEPPLGRDDDRRSVIDITEDDDTRSHRSYHSGKNNFSRPPPEIVPAVHSTMPELPPPPSYHQQGPSKQSAELKTLEESVSRVACTQDGAEVLSKKIASGSDEELNCIFRQVLNNLLPVTTDIYGCQVVIKLIELGTSMQRNVLINMLKTKGLGFKGLSQHKFGYKVVVKILEVCPLPMQLEVLEEIKGNALYLSKNIHGRHVIEACLSVMGVNYVGFIIQEVRGHVVDMLRDMDGMQVIKMILLQLPQELSGSVFAEIIDNIPTIVTDSCGSKIINILIENGHGSDTYHVIQALRGVFIFVSQKPHCLPILSKCISLAQPEQVNWMLDEMCGVDDAGLLVMMKDASACVVLLEILKACDMKQRAFLLGKINSYMSRLHDVDHGERLYHSLKQFQPVYQNGGRR